MPWVGIALGTLGPVLIGFFVYRYRSVITYNLVSMCQSFGIENAGPVPSQGWPEQKITLERLELRNRGFRNLRNVRLHLEHTPALFAKTVSATASIGKSSVKLQNDGDDLLIEIDEFPRAESVIIELSYFGPGGWGQYRALKGASGTYKVTKLDHWEAYRSGVLQGAFIFIVFMAVQIALGLAAS